MARDRSSAQGREEGQRLVTCGRAQQIAGREWDGDSQARLEGAQAWASAAFPEQREGPTSPGGPVPATSQA